MATLCSKCPETATLRCSKCKTAYYCSVECQKDDWNTGRHPLACIQAELNIGDKLTDIELKFTKDHPLYFDYEVAGGFKDHALLKHMNMIDARNNFNIAKGLRNNIQKSNANKPLAWLEDTRDFYTNNALVTETVKPLLNGVGTKARRATTLWSDQRTLITLLKQKATGALDSAGEKKLEIAQAGYKSSKNDYGSSVVSGHPMYFKYETTVNIEKSSTQDTKDAFVNSINELAKAAKVPIDVSTFGGQLELVYKRQVSVRENVLQLFYKVSTELQAFQQKIDESNKEIETLLKAKPTIVDCPY